ncbi:MAG: copper chaperone CopZ [Syntrophomonadaceae bacterium]|nr:copper chaperone CopZ [Syntrophomonadaceae bacterium]
MANAILNVKGMSCHHCEHSVKTSVGSLAGVKNVQVELKDGKVKIEYDSAQVDLKTIQYTIEDQGYEVER